MDKFQLFFEEMHKINLSENLFSQVVSLQITRNHLQYTKTILHQLASVSALGERFEIEHFILALQQISHVESMIEEQNQSPQTFVQCFSYFFQDIEHLSHVLRYAPPEIKKRQLALVTEILLKNKNQQTQITQLCNQRIKTIIQQSLEYSSQEFNHQTLVHHCIFVLLERSIQDNFKNYQDWLLNFSNQIDKFLKHACLSSQSILDGMEQFEHLGKTLTDLFTEAEGQFGVDLSFNQAPNPELFTLLQIKRQILEKLRFGQERRYDYFKKICRNTIKDYLSVSQDLKENYLADNHLSDETYANLSRRMDLARILETIHTQNQASFKAPLFVEELMGVKIYNVGQLSANLALKSFPFLGHDRSKIQTFILQTKGQFKSRDAQQKLLKKYLEKAQVIAYSLQGQARSEIKFAICLNYASTALLNFCLDHGRFVNEDEIAVNPLLNLQCLTIQDSQNLNESVIQNAIRARESERINALNSQRANLQTQIDFLRQAKQQQQQVQFRLSPLEKNIQELNNQKYQHKQLIKRNQTRLAFQQKSQELADHSTILSGLYIDAKGRHESLKQSIASTEQKLSSIKFNQLQHKRQGGFLALDKIMNGHLLKRLQQEQAELGHIHRVLLQLEPLIETDIPPSLKEPSPLPENLMILCDKLVKKNQQLRMEIADLQKIITSLESIEIIEPHQTLEEIEKKLQEQLALHQQIIATLPNACYQEFHQLDTLEDQFKTLSEQLIDKRLMFAAFKENFPAKKIRSLGLTVEQENCFRKLLELFSIYQEAKLVPSQIVLDLFEQLELDVNQAVAFPKHTDAIDQEINDLFKLISEIPLSDEFSADLQFSIKRQQALAFAQNNQENIPLIEDYLEKILSESSPQMLDKIKQDLFNLFIKTYHPNILAPLNIDKVSVIKVHQDLLKMFDNLFRIAKAVRQGKSFVTEREVQDYCNAILKVSGAYHQEKQLCPILNLPDFESLGFKLKHSQRQQVIHFYNAQQQSIISIHLELEQELPYSLRKFPRGGYFLSYGGSRGINYQALTPDKRLMTNSRLIGHGQYGSVSQTCNLLSLTEIALKQVVTSSQATEIFDPHMQTQTSLRALYARPDNLNQDEEYINKAYNQAINSGTPKYPIIQPIKPSLYVQDVCAKKIAGAQNLALGNSLADLSRWQRQKLTKEMAAYHNPLLRPSFDLIKQITELLVQAHATLNAIDKYHRLGFTHGDIKPENIMLHQKPGGQYEAFLIDKATSAFQRTYLGGEDDLLIIFKQLFTDIAIKHQDQERIESPEGFYVQKLAHEIVYGKKAYLEISYGARNCTLPFIAPSMITDSKASTPTVMTYANKSMDNWAATVLLFGICHQTTYFNLVKGRIASDYRVPGILKVTGTKSEEMGLEIESFALFNEFFSCEASNQVMYVPSNAREGEPWHLYRYLKKMSEVMPIQEDIHAILETVFQAIESGNGLPIPQLKTILQQIEQCKILYEKILNSEITSPPIAHEIQFEKALCMARSNQPNALRMPIDEQHCVLDILCLYAKTPEQISETKTQLELHKDHLMTMLIGANAISHDLLQQCLAMHQQDILLCIIEKISNHPSFSELIENTQLVRQATQENLTEVFLALKQPMPNYFPTPFLKWNKNALEMAIDNRNQTIINSLLDTIELDRTVFLNALRQCAFNDNLDLYQKILTHFNQHAIRPIDDEAILSHHPISAYHIWLSSPKNWQMIKALNTHHMIEFLTSPENPLLMACQFANLAAIIDLINIKPTLLQPSQWQRLICSSDLEQKNMLHHALENQEKLEHVINLFSFIQTHFGEQQIISLLLQEPRPLNYDKEIIKALLINTQDAPLQQMALMLAARTWLLQNPCVAQALLEDMSLYSPQTRLEALAFLSMLEGPESHFFKSILKKYLPLSRNTANFAFNCLLHPKIRFFLDDALIQQLEITQQHYQLQQCQQTLPVIVEQLHGQDQILFNHIRQLIERFQLTQLPIASQIQINQQTLDRLNWFCQTYAANNPPENFVGDFLSIFDTFELKALLAKQMPQDLKGLSQKFGPVVMVLLKSELSASDKLQALEQIRHLKIDIQSYLLQIKHDIEERQKIQFKASLKQICQAIMIKINELQSRQQHNAAARLKILHQHLSREIHLNVDQALIGRCHRYFKTALMDKELRTHRHWLIAWIYRLLGLHKVTKTIELVQRLDEEFATASLKIANL